MSKRMYTFESGKILRSGELVGSYDEDSRKITGLDAKLAPNIRGIIDGILRPRRLAKIPTGDEYSSEQPPPQDPKLGDKTPAYIAWLRRTKPKEAERRYSGRKVSLEASASVSGDIPEVPMDNPEEHWGPHQ
jgi:hypothetical protein